MQQNRRRAPRVSTRNGRGASGMNAQPGGRAATRILVPALVLSVCAAAAQAQTTPNLNSNGLLQPFNTLLGSTALTTNLQTAISINNASTAAQRAQAVTDNTINTDTGILLADGLGTRMTQVFQSAINASAPAVATTGTIVQAFRQLNGISQADSGFNKYWFANGTTNGTTASTLANPRPNIYDQAYGVSPLGSKDQFGDSRPYQVSGSIQNYATSITGGLTNNPAFPSGHTTYAYTQALMFAVMVPERYQQLLTRASEYGNSRIVLGAHYPLDVIGGRIIATYDVVQMLNNNPAYLNQQISVFAVGNVTTSSDYATLFANATTDLRGLLTAGCGTSIANCSAASGADRFSSAAQNKADYTYRLTYGLQPTGPTNLAPVVPTGAEVLLASRFPYLTAAQRRDVLASTELPSGAPLDNGSGWARLNLYAAADGYGAFASNVAVTMTGADSWNNDIGGIGGLALGGSGALTLSGANTYSGATTVNGGILSVNGSIVSPVTVNAGGVLRGTGTIGGTTTVASGGRLAPGNSPGTLTFTAPVTLAGGSTTEFDIDGTGTGNGAGNYSRIIVTGGGNTLTTGGTLLPLLRGITGSATNSYTPPLGQTFQVISAQGGVNGSFSGLAQPAGLASGTRFDALYNTQTLTLVVTPASYASLGAFGVAETANQAAVATALDAGRPAAGVAPNAGQGGLYSSLYTLPARSLGTALTQLAPTVYGDGLMIGRDDWYLVSRAIETELGTRRGLSAGPKAQSAAGPGDSTVWLTGLGQFTQLNSDNAPGFHNSTGGFVAGIDVPLQPALRIGAAVGFTSFDASTSGSAEVSGQAVQLMVYGSYGIGMFFLDGQAGGVFSEADTKRTLSGWGLQAKGSPDSSGGGGSLRAGAHLDMQGWQVEPSLSLGGVGLNMGSLTETQAGGAGLAVGSGSVGSLQTLLGVRAERRFAVGETMAVVPSVQVGWAHEFLDVQAKTQAAFLGATASSFVVQSAPYGRDSAILGLRAELQTGGPLTFHVGYAGALNGNSQAQTITGGLRYVW